MESQANKRHLPSTSEEGGPVKRPLRDAPRLEHRPYLFFTRQFQKMSRHLEIQELKISVNTTSFLPHIQVSVSIGDSTKTTNYIQSDTGCRVGTPGRVSAWRCSAEKWRDLAIREIGGFLGDCCVLGVAIRKLSLFTDCEQDENLDYQYIFTQSSSEAVERGLTVKELHIEHKNTDLMSVFGTMKQFKAQVVTIKISQISMELARELRGFNHFCSEHTHLVNFEGEIWENVRNEMKKEKSLEDFERNVEEKRVIYIRHDIWVRQLRVLDRSQSVEGIEISVNTKAFLPNVCVVTKINNVEDKVHFIRSDTGCCVGVPENVNQWKSMEASWMEQATNEVVEFVRRTTFDYKGDQVDKPIKNLKISLDLKRNSEDPDNVKKSLEKICMGVANWKQRVEELSFGFPEGTITDVSTIINPIKFNRAFIHVASYENRFELEDIPMTAGASCTISFENPMFDTQVIDVTREAFDDFDADVDERNGTIVLTKKTA